MAITKNLPTEIEFSWDPIDSELVKDYEILRGEEGQRGRKRESTSKNRFSVSELKPETDYIFSVQAVLKNGRKGEQGMRLKSMMELFDSLLCRYSSWSFKNYQKFC